MRIRLTGAAAAMAFSAVAAVAADRGGPTPDGAAPVSPRIAFSWLDSYIAGNPGDRERSSERRFGRGQSTLGVEIDLRFANAGDTFANYKFANPWFGTVRGRSGIALDNILFYGTLGLAYGRGDVALAGLAASNLHPDAGPDSAGDLAQSLSAKAQHLYIDFGREPDGLGGTGNGPTNSVARIGRQPAVLTKGKAIAERALE
jgi:outer membrane immunogenic protein